MALKLPRRCAACGSRTGAAGLAEFHCYDCNRLTDENGVLVPLEVQNHGKDFVDESKIEEG